MNDNRDIPHQAFLDGALIDSAFTALDLALQVAHQAYPLNAVEQRGWLDRMRELRRLRRDFWRAGLTVRKREYLR